MILAFILVLIVAGGGFTLTYLFAEDETFLWRIAAGNIIGSTIFGLIGFIIASAFGLSTATAALAAALSLTPLLLLIKNNWRGKLRADWTAATGTLQNAELAKLANCVYYTFFFILFVFFFIRAMYETSAGIWTGSPHNLGDLPFHLGAIYSFTEGNNFPPQNPSFAGATFSYPFIADLLTALTMKFGGDVESVMFVQNVSWAFALLVILERFTFKLTGSKAAGKIAPALLFFSGGLGFWLFYKEFAAQSKDLSDFLFNLPANYAIREKGLRWGNSLDVLFITQRSILLGMPLTLVVLDKLWAIFSSDTAQSNGEKTITKGESSLSAFRFPLSIFIVGLLAGTLPLVHLHSLFVLFIVAAFLFVLKPENWREWIVFGVGVGIVAVPELLWSLNGSASHASEFFGWHFGWDKGDDENFVWFWFKNTGVFVPLVLAGIFLKFKVQSSKFKVQDSELKIGNQKLETRNLKLETGDFAALFYLPFLFCFIIANVYKFAPWQWDNIKILIYWFVGSVPFAAYALAWAWRKNVWLKLIAAGLFFVLTAAGALDIWRVASKQINYGEFDADAVKIAAQIKQKTAPDAMFLNAPTYNTPIVLTGRRSLMRYVGHLSSHGIDYESRLADLQKMYQGDATAELLMNKYNIEYVLISPEEKDQVNANEDYFSRFPVVAESGQYRVYKVKNDN